MNRIILTGLFFLVAANLWMRFAPLVTGLSEDFVDSGSGVLMGVAIGCMLLGIRRGCRHIDRSSMSQ